MSATQWSWRRIYRRNALVFLLAGAAIAAWGFATFSLDRRSEADAAYTRALNLADLLAEYTGQLFRGIDYGLVGLAESLDMSRLGEPSYAGPAHALLSARRALTEDVFAFFVLDGEGRVLYSSRTPSPEPVDLSSREIYQRAIAGEQGLIISRPITGAVGYAEGEPILNVSRPLYSDGEPVGVVAAAISLSALEAFYAALELGPYGAVGLFRDDGVLLARSPPRPEIIGRDFSDVPLFQEHLPAAPRGTYYRSYYSDGRYRYSAYRRASGEPLVAFVGLDAASVMASWRQRTAISGGALVLVLALLGWLFLRSARAEASERALEAAYGERLETLAGESRELVAAPDADTLAGGVLALALRLVTADHACLRLRGLGAEGHEYRRCVDGDGRRLDAAALPEGGFVASVLAEGSPRQRMLADGHWLGVPVLTPDRACIGALELYRGGGSAFRDDESHLLQQLVAVAGAVLENQRARAAERRALEANVAAAREKERILESISDALFVLDRDWRFTYLNERACQLLERDDLEGENVWEAFPEARDTEAYRHYHHAMASGETVSFEFYYPPLERWFSVRAYPFADGLSVYFQDVSERVAMQQQLQQAQKMEVIGQLTGGVAHDFNNLLTVILGNTEILLEETSAGSAAQDAARLTQRAAERAQGLTQRLLAFARRQPLAPEALDVARLLREMEPLVRRSLGETVMLETVSAAGLWQAFADAGQLEAALLNLAVNARDAMPEGGRLTIEAANAHINERYAAAIPELEPGQYVVVAVSDTGAGMDDDTRERAFEPFFTTKGKHHGSGLGLSMVYGFAKQSQGNVTLYSEPGEGTTVKVYLPRWHGQTASGGPKPLAPPVPEGNAGRGECLLVVEDDPMVRRFVVNALAGHDFRVIEAADATTALEQAAALPRPPELLLTDVVLGGGMNGPALADRLTDRFPGLRVLYMSGYTENAIVHHGRLDPGVDLLQKPFGRAELLRRLRTILDRP
ncbi:ATP-binding protein [Spiribacter halobius]|uniref:ATP-binding protein n=1 Tax=Sediminicurvatus halobius TaxID=2182432 RepID=UPI001304E292|nr:cache domain-containing protein [Spiribacter halobius]UEX78693.1 PAS domain-containing protein [Spiribacter halobius]